MQGNSAYIDDPEDAELQKAWTALSLKVGTPNGWQYMGSEFADGAWVHSFRSKYKMEAARNEQEYKDARQKIPASDGWRPEHAE